MGALISKAASKLLLQVAAGELVSLLLGCAIGPWGAGRALATSGTCPAPAVDFGKDTITVSVPAAGTYREWSHTLAPSVSASTYRLQVDSAQCFSVGGGSSVVPNTWTWTGYADGNVAEPMVLENLAAGRHTFTLIGEAAGVMVDNILLTSDASCVPTGNGSNCDAGETAASATPPNASGLPAPAAKSGGGGKKSPKTAANWLLIGAIVTGVAVTIGAGAWAWWRKRREVPLER